MGIVIVAKRVHDLLPYKVLPFALELYLSGLQVHLPSVQAVHLLLKVGHVDTRTLVLWREPEHLLSKIITINMVAHVRRGIGVDVVEVILWSIPREDVEEGIE